MGLIILLVVLLLLFGGGGFYYGPPYHYYGGGLGLVLLIVVVSPACSGEGRDLALCSLVAPSFDIVQSGSPTHLRSHSGCRFWGHGG